MIEDSVSIITSNIDLLFFADLKTIEKFISGSLIAYYFNDELMYKRINVIYCNDCLLVRLVMVNLFSLK